MGSVRVVPASLVRFAGTAGKALCWTAFVCGAAESWLRLQPSPPFAARVRARDGARVRIGVWSPP